MSRRDVLVDPTETRVEVELVDVETTYYIEIIPDMG